MKLVGWLLGLAQWAAYYLLARKHKNGAAPELGTSLDTRYLQALGTVDERMPILGNIEKLMASRDMWLVELAAA